MKIINSTKFNVTVVSGFPAVHPMGIGLINSLGGVVPFTNYGLIPTSFTYMNRANVQIIPSLGWHFYVHVFGAFPGDAVLEGLVFRNKVNQVNNEQRLQEVAPMFMFKYIGSTMWVTNTGRPVQLYVASDGLNPGFDLTIYEGFLTAGAIMFGDPETLVGNFKLEFAITSAS